MQISEAELRAMTAELDDMHHATLPAMHEALHEWTDKLCSLRSDVANSQSSRRGFLLGAGVALGGLALAACGSSSRSGAPAATTPATTSGSTGAPKKLTGDLAVVGLAAGLENLAV